MTNFIPIFPLGIVVFPGEKLNLHIFEERYRQLIKDSFEAKKPFGIPTVTDQKIQEMGTLVQVTEISKVYDDGKMDIKTEATRVFRILEMINTVPDKLYSGAIVHFPVNHTSVKNEFMPAIIAGIRALHKLLNIEKDFGKLDAELASYDVAHHAGLSIAEEYEFLQLMYELQRQEFLKRHLARVLPVIAEMETLKKKIKLNGHFKNLSGYEGL